MVIANQCYPSSPVINGVSVGSVSLEETMEVRKVAVRASRDPTLDLLGENEDY